MLIDADDPRILGVEAGARLRFGEEAKQESQWAGRRLMWLDERPAYELSFWCGTCQFMFKRLEGSNQTLSIAEFSQRLNDGLDTAEDDVAARFAELLPTGSYQPILLQVEPRLVTPSGPGDYFCEDQLDTWNSDGFWGLPEYPATPYYRTYESTVDADSRLYEFVVPMVPPSWNEPDRVREYALRLAASTKPTAVAVSILDVRQPANAEGPDYYRHWLLTHFLLDGHHKLQAAAESASPVRLLSLLSLDASLAAPDELANVVEMRSRTRVARHHAPRPRTT